MAHMPDASSACGAGSQGGGAVAFEAREQIDYEWITPSKARVLRELAMFHTEREGAANLRISYEGFRSAVEVIKDHTGLRDVREIGRWWLKTGPEWLKWMAEQGGVGGEGYGS
jgi:hypothetical protein